MYTKMCTAGAPNLQIERPTINQVKQRIKIEQPQSIDTLKQGVKE
jgi:hypothetical protein